VRGTPRERFGTEGETVDLLLLGVISVVALALLFDFSNGFHDAANSVATVVATRAMPARWAVWFSAACNFAAYFFVGTAVANTVANTVKPSSVTVAVVFSALFAAVAWNYFTWHFGMPSSSSHAIIGGLVGAGVAAGGIHVISWGSVRKTVLAIVASPLVALVVAVAATALVIGVQRVTRLPDDAKPFRWLQLVSAAAVSFGHGANDAQKTMGVIAALLAGSGYLHSAPGAKDLPVPEWAALSSYAAIAIGTAWGGWKIIDTMGLRLTRLNPRTAVAANIGATTAIFGATTLGVPISTTHAAASSVVGAGAAARTGTNWKVIGEMVTAWVATIPVSAAVGWSVYRGTRLPTVAAVIVIGSAVLALLGAIGWAMLHAVSSRQVEAKVGSGPHALPATAVPEPSQAA
jgi:inorganic phosphate transporter, PiT family